MGIESTLVKLCPIKDRKELEDLVAQAAEDSHSVYFPSHRIVKDGETIGYVSLGRMPVVNYWMHSEKGKVRDTLQVMNLIDHLMDAANVPAYMMPCAKSSPYYESMEKLGYKKLYDSTLFVKRKDG